jgi:hypothetical protein
MEMLMKKISVICLILFLLGIIVSSTSWARGGGGQRGGRGGFSGGQRHFGGHRNFGRQNYGGRHFGGRRHGGWGYGGGFYGWGLGFGPGFYGGYYPNYGWYPPTVVTVPVTPPVYIQQSPPVVQSYQPGYWYYCTNPQGYYPYVRECPYGWQQVAPVPSNP